MDVQNTVKRLRELHRRAGLLQTLVTSDEVDELADDICELADVLESDAFGARCDALSEGVLDELVFQVHSREAWNLQSAGKRAQVEFLQLHGHTIDQIEVLSGTRPSPAAPSEKVEKVEKVEETEAERLELLRYEKWNIDELRHEADSRGFVRSRNGSYYCRQAHMVNVLWEKGDGRWRVNYPHTPHDTDSNATGLQYILRLDDYLRVQRAVIEGLPARVRYERMPLTDLEREAMLRGWIRTRVPSPWEGSVDSRRSELGWSDQTGEEIVRDALNTGSVLPQWQCRGEAAGTYRDALIAGLLLTGRAE